MGNDESAAGTFAWAAVAAICLSALAYAWPYTTDDTFIYLRYAFEWLKTGTLTWEPSLPPSQGFTSPLWMLASTGSEWAGAGATGIKLLGALLHLLALVAIARWLLSPAGSPSRLPRAAVLAVVAFLGVLAPLAVPAISGMETPLDVAACVALAILLLSDAPASARPGVRFGVGCLVGASYWVRPDALPPLGIALATRVGFDLLAGRVTLAGSLWTFAGVPLAPALWALYSQVAFGHVVPNSALLKMQGGGLVGLRPVGDLLRVWLAPVLAASIVVGLSARGRPDRLDRGREALALGVLGALLATHLAFFTSVDPVMNFAQRFHSRAFPLLILFGVTLGAQLRHRYALRVPLPVWPALGAAVVLHLALLSWPEYAVARRRGAALANAHARIGMVLRECAVETGRFGELVLATHDSGVLPYAWRGPAVDMIGLGTREFLTGELTVPAAAARWPLVVVHRMDSWDARPAEWRETFCGGFTPVSGAVYMGYPIGVMVPRHWHGRDARPFTECVTRGLGYDIRPEFAARCSALSQGSAGNPSRAPALATE